MDETSPGTSRPGPDDVRSARTATKRAPTRMDTLLATLQKDIKTLCQQGDLVSQKVLRLYQTFEGVIHQEAILTADSAKLNEDATTEDEDSGVAMATSEFQDAHSSDRTGVGYTGVIAVSEVSNGSAGGQQPAWYEVEDDENGDELSGDGFAPRKAARSGLTEEWIKYGHFQLKGKHHEPANASEQAATQKEGESVLYDWESFTGEDDEETLAAYDWDAFEENTLSNVDSSVEKGFHRDRIFSYSVEDKKVVPVVPRQHVQSTIKDVNRAKGIDPYRGSEEPACKSRPVGTGRSGVSNTQPQRRTDNDDLVKIKRRELYRKISSDIVDRLSRQTVNKDWKQRKTAAVTHCDHRHLVCTCPHSHTDGPSDVRATSGSRFKEEDKNNNNNNKTTRNKHKPSRIMTNGSFECRLGSSKRKTREHESRKVANVKAAGQLDHVSHHCHGRSTADQRHIPNPHSAQRKLQNGDVRIKKDKKVKNFDGHSGDSKHAGCVQAYSVSNIAGDRRPLFYDIEKALDASVIDLPECECEDIKKERANINFNSEFKDHHPENAINKPVSDPYYSNVSTEESVSEDMCFKPMSRLTWDLADSPLPLDEGLLSRDRTPHLRASYAGPNKRLFPGASSCNPGSNFSRCSKPTRTTPTTSKGPFLDSAGHRDSLRLCGIRYAGFQAAWPNINAAGNRRSFSGFTIVDTPKDKSRWGTESKQLQPTYC